MENIHWLTSDDLFGRTIRDGNIWGVPCHGREQHHRHRRRHPIGLTESEAKSRRYDGREGGRQFSKAESLIEEMCADTALPSFSLGVYDNALPRWTARARWRSASADLPESAKENSTRSPRAFRRASTPCVPRLAGRLSNAQTAHGNIAVLELQLSHTKPYLKEDATPN